MLFLDHVKSISSFVNRKGKIPIMWDDMLRNMPQSEIKVRISSIVVLNRHEIMLKESGVGNIVEVMVWSYVDNIDTYIDYTHWRMYSELFRG